MINKENVSIDKIRFSTILGVSVFLIVLVVELLLVGNSNLVNNKIFSDRIENDLIILAELNARYAGILLEEEKEKLRTLADTELVESELEAIVKERGSQENLNRLTKELIEIHENDNDDFWEVYVIDLNSKVVSSSNPESMERKIETSIDFLSGEEEARVSEIYYSDILNKNVIDISAKIFTEEEEQVGALVAVLTLKELSRIVNVEGLGETGESYVINKEGFLITPAKYLKGENRGLLTQHIDTENARKCVDEIINREYKEEKEAHPVLVNYLDYRGEEVFGTHFPIPQSEWCVIVKIDSSEVFSSSRNVFLKNLIVLPVIILLIFTFLAFSCGRFLDKYRERNDGGI